MIKHRCKVYFRTLYNDASSINLCKIDDFCIDENESNYKKAYEIFLDLYENDNDQEQHTQ